MNYKQVGNTPYILGMRHTVRVFLMWCVQACASAIACLSYPTSLITRAMGFHVETLSIYLFLIDL